MPTYCDCESLQKRIEELEAKLRDVPWTEEEWSEQQKLSQAIEKEGGWILDQSSILTWNRGWVSAMRFAKNRIKERQ